MPLINQPTLNADLSGISSNPYIDWKTAKTSYLRVGIAGQNGNTEIVSLSGTEFGSLETAYKWTQSASNDWSDGVLPVSLGSEVLVSLFHLGDNYKQAGFVVVKQALYVIPEYTSEGACIEFFPNTSAYDSSDIESIGLPDIYGTAEPFRGLKLYSNGYWESQEIIARGHPHTWQSGSVSPPENPGEIMGILLVGGADNALLMAGKTLEFTYSVTIAKMIE